MSVKRTVASLAVSGTLFALTACGGNTHDKAAQDGLKAGWASVDVDTQVMLCGAYHTAPKSVVAEFAADVAGKGYTAADIDKFLSAECAQ